MKIELTGTDARYTVEQLCQMLFPETEGCCRCRMTKRDGWLFAACRITVNSEKTNGLARCRLSGDVYRDVNLERRTLARAVYRAAEPMLTIMPAWGMLSGVRPAKLTRAHLERGGTLSGAAGFLQREYFVSREKALLCAEAGRVAADVHAGLRRNGFSLYVHIPFCPSRCTYCSFISADGDAFKRWGDRYFSVLLEELSMLGNVRRARGLVPESVYIGGGTPAIYSAERLAQLCAAIKATCGSLPEEFTVEAGRPDAITAEKLAALRRGGVTRVCVNPQTMHDATLRSIGRAHTAAETCRAFRLAREAGFPSINCDLIAGLPGERAADFRETLDKILDLSPENITVHTLARKRGSAFNEQHTGATPAEELLEMLEIARTSLSDAGYLPYYLYRQKYTGGGFENVGWTKPGYVCLYNVCMMEEIGDILSAGAGAATKLTTRSFTRLTNPKYPAEYLSALDSFTVRERELLRYYEVPAAPTRTIHG